MIRTARTWLAVLPFALLVAGCGSLPAGQGPASPESVPPVDGEPPGSVLHPASASLLQQSRAQQRDGRPDLAAATLERALRIDPSAPAIWLEMARLRYTDGDWPGAEQYARRARSLAAADTPVAAAARELIADALAMQGRVGEAERLRDDGRDRGWNR